MNRRDIMLAVLVVSIWGANFTVTKLGLLGVPSMLLGALRYIITVFPAIFFIKKPAVEWRYIISYGLTVGVGQFACLFYALEIGMPAGVASVVLQSQAFFTLLFAHFFLKEKVVKIQLVGLAIAASGLYLIGMEANTSPLSAIPLGAFLFTLLAASFWGLSNIITRQASQRAVAKGVKLDMLSLIVWSSLIPPIPFFLLALFFNSPLELWQAMSSLNGMSIFAILYIAILATVLGYGVWGSLLMKYNASRVAPLSMLVPIAGLITAQIVLGERLSILQWVGGFVILLGLLTSNFGEALLKRKQKEAPRDIAKGA